MVKVGVEREDDDEVGVVGGSTAIGVGGSVVGVVELGDSGANERAG